MNIFKVKNMARPKKAESELLQIRVPVEIKKELKLKAVMEGTTMSQIILDAYELYKKKGKDGKK